MTEHQETVLFANWLRANGYLFFKVPSETYTTSWNQKRKNSAEGSSKGFPDMVIVLKRGSLAFVEMKKAR